MAVYGAGSNWAGKEQAFKFFEESHYEIGWLESEAQDLYQLVRSLKLGDFIYLKANRPGSLHIRVKGVGIVTGSPYSSQGNNKETNSSDNSSSLSLDRLPIKWIIKQEFHLDIPQGQGKLTNIRAATFYEESHPYVITEILNRIWP